MMMNENGNPYLMAALQADELHAPASMNYVERRVIANEVLVRKPRRALEIGTWQGGTAAIIVDAMEYNGHGVLVCLDPNPQWGETAQAKLRKRARLVMGSSPADTPDAAAVADGLFDLVFVDGLHTYDAVMADVLGVIPYLSEHAVLLFHDSNDPEVRRAIQDCVARFDLIDRGAVSNEIRINPERPTEQFGGIWKLERQPVRVAAQTEVA